LTDKEDNSLSKKKYKDFVAMNIQFEILDPRPIAISSVLEQIADWKKEGKKIIGFEVTVPQQAALLDLNIDPQHSGGNSEMSCIMEVLKTHHDRLSYSKAVCVTNRPDLDSVGGMAAWEMLSMTEDQESMGNALYSRIEKVHKADCFQHGEWKPQELFQGGYEQAELAAIARAVSDFKVPLNQRVRLMSEWLWSGKGRVRLTEDEVRSLEAGVIAFLPKDVDPLAAYQAAYEKECDEIRSAIASGETKVTTYGDLVFVNSKLRAATSIGYSKRPVVIAFNPEMPSKNGPYKKFTVCQYREGYVDLIGAVKALNELEPGWGGSPNIIGSPQEQDSCLTIDQVMEIIRNFAIIRP
jgi:hypothetical protein